MEQSGYISEWQNLLLTLTSLNRIKIDTDFGFKPDKKIRNRGNTNENRNI